MICKTRASALGSLVANESQDRERNKDGEKEKEREERGEGREDVLTTSNL